MNLQRLQTQSTELANVIANNNDALESVISGFNQDLTLMRPDQKEKGLTVSKGSLIDVSETLDSAIQLINLQTGIIERLRHGLFSYDPNSAKDAPADHIVKSYEGALRR